jgi:hypothetical protein
VSLTTEQQLRAALRALDSNAHPEYCEQSTDKCSECGWEFDDHPVRLVHGRVCKEFELQPCTCGISAALALPETSGRVEYRVRYRIFGNSDIWDAGCSQTEALAWAAYRSLGDCFWKALETCTVTESPWVPMEIPAFDPTYPKGAKSIG